MHLLAALYVEASAEVVPAPAHAAECVALHPNEPCPGYPHTDEPEEGTK